MTAILWLAPTTRSDCVTLNLQLNIESTYLLYSTIAGHEKNESFFIKTKGHIWKLIGERARHSQVCSIEYCDIYVCVCVS